MTNVSCGLTTKKLAFAPCTSLVIEYVTTLRQTLCALNFLDCINVDSAAIACLGGMYEKLGRMVGRSYEETISLLVKALKNAEVQDIS